MYSPKNIYILGAGAMGSIYGAGLSEKYPVTLIARSETVNKIKNNGLEIRGLINKTYKLPAQEKITRITDNAIIFLTTKVHESDSAIQSIKSLVKKDTLLVVVQNGVGQEKEYQKKLNCIVIRAVSECGAAVISPGIVKFNSNKATYVNKNGGGKIAHILKTAGFKVQSVNDIKKKEWEKLIINCVINPLGAILNVRNDKLNHPVLEKIKENIVKECVEVANATGVRIEQNYFKKVNNFISKTKNYNSTLQDLKLGKTTEIDYLNGKIVELGKKYSIETSINQMLFSLIKAMEDLAV